MWVREPNYGYYCNYVLYVFCMAPNASIAFKVDPLVKERGYVAVAIFNMALHVGIAF